MTPHAHPRRNRLQRRLSGRPLMALGLALALVAAGGACREADAHLSIIRQGAESAGTAEAGDRFGAAVATGDFNGDGYDDLATGAPDENVGLASSAGSVVISWGSEFGLTHTGAVYLTALSLGGTSTANAQFGYALASGDFNADGYADLVIGAPGEIVSGLADAGRIYVLRGGAAGLMLRTTYTQTAVGETVETGDRWGDSFAVGNFNGDATGYMDVAVGSPGEDGSQGMVAQFLGSSLFLSPSSTTFRIGSFGVFPAAQDRFGHSMASGNLFGDSKDDVAVSAPNRASGVNSLAGAVFLLRGTSSGLAVSGLSILTAAAFDNVNAAGLFGAGLAAGRFFGGSFDGLAVGEPGRTYASRQFTGRVLVFRGGTLGIGSAIEVTQADCGGTSQSNEYFGWHLAAGTFQDVASATYEDLGIGWTDELGNPAATASGAVAVLYGGFNGPTGAYGWANYDQGALNDWRTAGDKLGAAVAFGHFDDSGKGALVAGAPGEDSERGQVHVIAPWRQRYGLTCHNAVVTDCAGNLIFTLRPFDRVYIASTTKAMTTLLAAERTALPFNDPKHVSLNAEYQAPTWVTQDIPGSQVPLFNAEVMTLRELMWTCLFMSGNDAAFAIADFCEGSGGYNTSVPAFIAAMNDKAAALGMTGTHFHNPAGLDNEPVGPELGEHYSTPYDMMLLSRAAMNNPIVREIVGSTDFSMTRRNAYGYTEEATFHNIFSGVLTNNIQPLNGIKGGRTPLAKSTGLFSVTGPALGDAIITTFLTDTDNGGDYIGDAAHLAEVGLAACNYTFTSNTPHYENLYLGEFESCEDCVASAGLEATWGPPGDRMFLLARTQGINALHARLELEHHAQMELIGGVSIPLGISPFNAHGPVVVRNLSTTSQTVQVSRSAGGAPVNYTIPAQGFVTLPAYTSPTQLGSFTLTLTNTSSNRIPVPFQVEMPFTVDATLNLPTPFANGQVPVTLQRPAGLGEDAVFLRVRGLDATGGGRLTVVVKEPAAVSAVAEPPATGDAAPVAHLLAGPNPSAAGAAVRLSFTLRAPGAVGTTLFDTLGRRVRALPEALLPAGPAALEWDGRDDDGRPVAAGLYFARVTLNGRTAAATKVLRVE